MKALTLQQPWAQLMVEGAKTIETRSWPTSYRGRVAIHAAAGLSMVGGKRGLRECLLDPLEEDVPFADALIGYGGSLPVGAIVGYVTLDEVVPTEAIGFGPIDGERRMLFCGADSRLVGAHEPTFGNYAPGRFAWVCRQPEKLWPPIEGVKGALGLWNYEERRVQRG